MSKKSTTNTASMRTSIAIDIGALKTTMAICAQNDSEPPTSIMIRNNDMNIATPSIVSFTTDGRRFGQAASNTMSSSVMSFSNLIDLCENVRDFSVEKVEGKVSSTQIVGMFLEHILKVKEMKEDKNADVIFVLPACSISAAAALRDAMKIAKMNRSTRFTTIGAALASAYYLKHGSQKLEKEKHVLIIDHGYSQLTVALIKLQVEGKPLLLAEKCVRGASNSEMDMSMFRHFQKEVETKYGVKPEVQSKLGKRLLKACVKAKVTLSAVKETIFMVDSITSNNQDARMKCDRNLLKRVCSAQLKLIQDTVRSVLNETNVESIDSIEMVGGGSRSPLVVQSIQSAVQNDAVTCQVTLDIKNSVSQGGAFLSAIENGLCSIESVVEKSEKEKKEEEEKKEEKEKKKDTTSLFLQEEEEEKETTISEEELSRVFEIELKLKEHDELCRVDREQKNDFETFLYKWRDVCDNVDSPFYQHVDAEFLKTTLDQEETWFFETGVDSGSKCAERLLVLRKEIETKCSAYIEAKTQDKLKREAELQAEQAAKKLAEDAKDPDQVDDFDRRKMSSTKRIRMAKKNKDEANELYKGKNYAPATKRYIKALQHCEKCYDMNPEEKEEVTKLKLSIYLNLAMSWLKLEKYERSIENASKALEIDAKSAKALYRRASGYEKLKNYDKAFKDVKAVLKIKPEDKSSLKLQSRIMKVLAKQKAKAKRMAKKMFG